MNGKLTERETINNAALMLSKCRKCLGCNQLEDMSFRGVKECRNYYENVDRERIRQNKRADKDVKKARENVQGDWRQSILQPRNN